MIHNYYINNATGEHQMNVQAIALIIKDSALQFLADKHGLTVDEVVIAVQSGNVRAAEQFDTLVQAGIKEAMALFA